ncbi:trypsin-like peptidase domain-containing protein [Sphingomonas sp.]|uniref:trypsin-like peptidase domain-containing protein n=1 Tax=Sphingomonas sp. TaxID=28214 RepID=UPI0028964331|nr:trypsin-like peptidase domain-containing protein [Sphingomonas sp.]
MILSSASHLFSCFCIKGEGGIGTAFVYHKNGLTLFVTAQHVLGHAVAGGFIYVKKPSGWAKFELNGVTSHPAGQDAATFGLVDFDITISHKFSYPGESPLALGQEIKFIGFPHGLENTASSPSGFSTPLVRTAFFSGVIIDPSTGKKLLILDGLNNPGYSGGPVWAPGPTQDEPTLLGLISGYRIEDRGKSLVYELSEAGERPTDNLFVKLNSGIIHAIDYADLMVLLDLSEDFNTTK